MIAHDVEMSVYGEIAAIVHPMPVPGSVVPEDIYNDACWQIEQDRKEFAAALEGVSDAADPGSEDGDPLTFAIAAARRRREQAEEEIRRLVAYGRKFTPRPYTLAGLAAAAGMSISGVRTAYDHDQVSAVAEAIGRPPRDWRASDPADPPEDHQAP
jgi:hypothetical protein